MNKNGETTLASMPGTSIARITILAATRMHNGICIAGVDNARTWFRPVQLPAFNFSWHMLCERGKVVVEPYNKVDFQIRNALNNSPQSEDHEIDVSYEPHLVRSLIDNELIGLMNAMDEHHVVELQRDRDDLVSWLVNSNRSLILTRIDRVLNAYRGETDYGRRPRRLLFRVGRTNFDMPCTDLRWRSITRGDRDAEALALITATPTLYFVLGLTRLFQGRYWPMVVGVHPLPRLVGKVDYDRL